MYITITNQNMETNYPLVLTCMNFEEVYEKSTGRTQCAIEIKDGSDLVELDSLARASSNRYRYMLYMNNAITLVDDTTNESEKGD